MTPVSGPSLYGTFTENSHDEAAADCVTVTVTPAIVSTPLRASLPGLASTSKVTVPAPVPSAPPVTRMSVLPLTAVHAHWAPALTLMLPLAAADPTLTLAGDTE